MTDVRYISQHSPSLVIKLVGRRCKAVNGVFTDLSAAEIADLEDLMKKRPSIRFNIKRVDMEAAAAKALEAVKNKPAAAIKGPVTSGSSTQEKLRQARAENQLTSLQNTVNISTEAKSDKPSEVTQIPVEAPKSAGSLLKRFQK